MRAVPFFDIIFNYVHLLHAHSHVAFQGWIYSALFLLISKLYIDDNIIKEKKYSLYFKLTILTILGIIVSFLFQGYALFSILFSSLFQLLNYWFAFRFFKDVRISQKAKKHAFSLKFIKVGFWMMILSTVGPWVVGILSAKGLNGSEFYDAALYFFLHFQYNGWFTFAILGIFFYLLEKYSIHFKQKEAQLFYILFALAVIPSYFLSLLGMSFRNYIIAFSYISAILQLIGLYYFIKSLIGNLTSFKERINYWTFLLLKIAAFTFMLKIVLQFASVFPVFKQLAFSNHFLIIAYIHLVMIGFISFFLLASLFQLRWITFPSVLSKVGASMLILGFVLSELILVLMGLGILFNNNLLLLLVFSTLMAIGLLLILINQFLKNTSVIPTKNNLV